MSTTPTNITVNDAQARRESMREALRNPPAEAVAEQTAEKDEGVETVADLLEMPAKKDKPAAAAEEQEELNEEEAAAADLLGEEEEEEEEEAAKPAEGDKDEPAGEEEEIPAEQYELLSNRSEVFDSLVEALDETDYPIPALAGQTAEEIAEGVQELSLRLADAHAVYSILDGKGADGIFERVKKFQGQEAHDYAVRAVLAYAEKIGLVEKTGAPEKKPGAAAVADPAETPREKALREENERLRREAGERRTTDDQTRVRERQMTVALAAVAAAEKHAATLGLSKEDFAEFVTPQLKGIGQNKAIFNRCARKNYVDLIQIVDRVHARLTGKRVDAGNVRVEKRKIRDRAFPKRVAGVETRRAAEPKADLSTSEGRRAAAKLALRG